MFDFFKPVLEFFEFIVKSIQSLINTVGMMSNFLTTLASWLPPEIRNFMIVLLAVCLIYKILGRDR